MQEQDRQKQLAERYGPDFFHRLEMLKIPFRALRQNGVAGGPHASPADGSSLDFKHQRPYSPGDDERLVDWNLYGRTRRLYTRMHHAEVHPRIFLLLDTSASMGFPSWQEKFQTALDIVMGLAYVGLASGYHVCLTPFYGQNKPDRPDGPDVSDYHSPGFTWTGPRDLMGNAVMQLAGITPKGDTTFSVLSRYAHQWRHTGGIVILISDFLVDIPGVKKSNKQEFSNPDDNSICREVSSQAYIRLATSVQEVAVPMRSFSSGRFYTALVALSGYTEEKVPDAAFVTDVETGNRLPLLLNAETEKIYRNTRECHKSLLQQMARKLNASFTQIVGGAGIPLRDMIQPILNNLAELERRRPL